MKILKTVLVSILALGLLVSPNASKASASAVQEPALANKRLISLTINSVTMLKKSGDLVGDGEFRIIIIASNIYGDSTGQFCPGTKPVKFRKGDSISSPCGIFRLSMEEDGAGDSVYFLVMVVDEDGSSLAGDLAFEAATTSFTTAMEKAIEKRAIKTLTKSAPVPIPVKILISYLSGKAKDWAEKADMLGTQGIHLSRNDNWSAGSSKTVTSSDGGIKLTYTVSVSTEGGSVPPASSSPSTPGASAPISTTTVKTPTGKTATISCANKLYFVRLRKSPGYKSKDDLTDTVAEIPCGETVTVLSGPTKKDSLDWYQISWKGKKGWVADYTSTGKLILIFNN